jgi:glycosyltransferase involved in cell wall biosynthesis
MRVSVVCYGPGEAAIERVGGIELHLVPRPTGGVKGLRFIHPRLTAIGRTVRKLAPDLVYNRTAGAYLGGLAIAVAGTRSRLIFAAASDRDFGTGVHSKLHWPDAPLFRFGARRAHAVLVQNIKQQALLRTTFNREGLIVPNAYEEAECRPGAFAGPVLWAGSIKPLKSPERFLELARRTPNRRFVMVGGPGNAPDAQRYLEGIEAAAAVIPNLELKGFVPFENVGRFFDGASVLVNTSDEEGFPNTFLQAWIRGIPSLSFVKPEVSPGQTGTIACSDLADMVERLQGLTDSEDFWRQAQVASLEHFDRTHSMDGALRLYRKVFEQVLR